MSSRTIPATRISRTLAPLLVLALASLACSSLPMAAPTPSAPPAPPSTATLTAAPLPSLAPSATAAPLPSLTPSAAPSRAAVTRPAQPGAQAAPLPKSQAILEGTPYVLFQAPGDPFRIVCQQPCAIADDLIFAKYAGFKAAHARLIALMGVDVPKELQPVDIHLNADAACGKYEPGVTTGFAAVTPGPAGRGMICLFDVEKVNRARPFTPQNAVLLEDQLLAVHEYAHVIFFRRHDVSYEDVVKAASFYVASSLTNPCDPALNQPNQGKLVYELCRRNGFQYAHLAPALKELDALYQTNQGLLRTGAPRPTTAVYQLRAILNRLLGGDTLPAFVTAGFLPVVLGDMGMLTPSGGKLAFVNGFITLEIPAGAVSQPVTVYMVRLPAAPQPPGGRRHNFDFDFQLLPLDLTFAKPGHITVQYDPARLKYAGMWIPEGQVSENTLQLGRIVNNAWQGVPGSSPNPANKTVGASLNSLGQFGLLGSP